MPLTLHTLTNDYWQVGILPETGGSTAFGRIRLADSYVDVLRPTAEADFGSASLCASFIMLPWANRLGGARFRFRGMEYQLEPSSADGSAIHGVVRRLPWQVVSASEAAIDLQFDSARHERINFPFHFSAQASFALDGRDFVMTLALHNEDTQAFPAGFGHHPYFLRAPGGAANRVHLEIPCDSQYPLVSALAVDAPPPVSAHADFRQMRPLDDSAYDDLLTGRLGTRPARIHYPDWGITLEFHADPVLAHWLLFQPPDKPFFALEPQSNANDGFNLEARGIRETGVFVLEPGETRSARAWLRIDTSV